jgi:hypothetical protein
MPRFTTPYDYSTTDDEVLKGVDLTGRRVVITGDGAGILLAVEAARRWADNGITANALMPGGVRSGLQRHQSENITPEIQEIFDNYPWKTPQQGAATSVLLAASPLLDGVTGRYFEDCNEAVPTTDPDAENGVRPHALDPRTPPASETSRSSC